MTKHSIKEIGTLQKKLLAPDNHHKRNIGSIRYVLNKNCI